jgi:hypothetical protein
VRRALGSLLFALLALASEARAQLETEAFGWRWRLELANRARWEDAHFFDPGAAGPENDYAFFGDKLQLGLRALRGSHEIFVQYQHSWLASLPESPLGTGGAYFVNNQERYDQKGIWRIAWIKGKVGLGTGLASAQVGRQLFRDGLESPLADPSLAWLQKNRIAERLIGPFDFTHVGRSFDGAQLQLDQETLNVTAFGFVPTAGGFELDANRELHVALGGASVTVKELDALPGASARIFGIWYRDRRDVVVLDNGAPDEGILELYTLGANFLQVFDVGPGRADLLLWGATQFGDWQTQDQEAYAFALEAGYQLPDAPGKPWLRVGWNVGSGDSDPFDGEHDTFFQILPTSRLYAQFPFYNLMNNDDLFVQLVLEPHERVGVTAAAHQLRRSAEEDFVYSGGGATKNDVFGYSAVAGPSTSKGIGTLLDVSLSVRPTDWLTLGAYYAHVWGRGALDATYAGENGSYAFVEATVSY